ncbi:WD40-repeat-containing domain protein [Apiospora phragmitis]|uniref:WD40-repeat-containing domain protein n=1 Tax=Apiospora phragmitis TaxID=2905665 RepID=A0ABR1V2U9_9PEZI
MSQSKGYAGAPRQSATGAGTGAGVSAAAAAPGGGYAAQHDELHISPTMTHQTQYSSSPREYTSAAGPALHIDPSASAAPHTQPTTPAYSSAANSSVPNVLQPGGLGAARPPAMSANTAPTLPTMSTGIPQQQSPTDYSSPSKPPSLSLSASTSHAYSRSSPAAPFESSGYTPYTPTTPGGSAGPSQYMSPQDSKYGAPGSQRNISNTPLGLADIRPRADSSLSDGTPGTLAYELANGQPSTSNYLAPWALYAFDWCKWAPQGKGAGKVAIGSYLEDGHNFAPLSIVSEFTKVAEATHSYPVTRLLWEPPSSQKQSTDLLATSGDHLRLWSLPSDAQSSYGNNVTRPNANAPITKLTPLALLSNSKTPDHTAPLTSLDWNQVSPSLIITSSIDTTCTIWDIPSLTAKTQLIAHDKEVYDVRFCANSVDVFVSCGQDGSVRMFDLRSLEHSTIIYEPTAKDDRGSLDATGGRISPTLAQQTMTNAPPLMRLATSPHDTHLLATFAQDSNVIRILDVRQPGQALLELRGHNGSVNCVEWSPLTRNAGVGNAPSNSGPGSTDKHLTSVASWQCDYEVGNLGWTPPLPNSDAGEWLGVSGGRGVWGVKI